MACRGPYTTVYQMTGSALPRFRFDVAAQVLREAREKAGLTQAELGRKMGGSQSHVSKIETGADVRISTLASVSRVLGYEVMLVPTALVPVVEALIRGEDESEPRPLYQPSGEDE